MSVVQLVTDTNKLMASGTSSAMLLWSMPILLAGVGGLYSERSGVVNIGLEGMMILGTWFGAYGAVSGISLFGLQLLGPSPWAGLLFGLIGGTLGGLLHAIATVTFGIDQIISGVAINILAPGMVRFLSEEIFVSMDGGSQTQSPRSPGLGQITLPFLAGGDVGSWTTPDVLGWLEDKNWFYISDLAGLAKGLVTGLDYFTIVGLAAVGATAWLVWKTKLGLRIRISGENPVAGESLGVGVYFYKYVGVTVSGALSGMAGAFIVLELTGFYREGQTVGRGFIALAALIFGNWRAFGVLAGSFVFAYPTALGLRDLDGSSTRAFLLVLSLSLFAFMVFAISRRQRIDAVLSGLMAAGLFVWFVFSSTAPDWLPNTMPYALVLVVLVFASQSLRPPRMLGIPYRKGESG
ncbi:MAG: ABC transporter permease [Acidimicrobiales bacterium]